MVIVHPLVRLKTTPHQAKRWDQRQPLLPSGLKSTQINQTAEKLVAQQPENAEAYIWQGIILSTYAGNANRGSSPTISMSAAPRFPCTQPTHDDGQGADTDHPLEQARIAEESISIQSRP